MSVAIISERPLKPGWGDSPLSYGVGEKSFTYAEIVERYYEASRVTFKTFRFAGKWITKVEILSVETDYGLTHDGILPCSTSHYHFHASLRNCIDEFTKRVLKAAYAQQSAISK